MTKKQARKRIEELSNIGMSAANNSRWFDAGEAFEIASHICAGIFIRQSNKLDNNRKQSPIEPQAK